jgi:hypothetical protein
VARRYGGGEPEALRSALGLSARELPDAPPPDDWYPIGWQLGMTRLVVDRHLAGEILPLEGMIHEDAQRDRKPEGIKEKMARLVLTPKRLLGASHKVYPHIYDAGRVEADVTRHLATLRWSGAAFMGEPVWRVLQVFAVRGVFTALRAPERRIEARDGGADGFELTVRY